ncbi:MAG: hypothetical protein ACSLE6_08220 [Mycobacterium sp.]
MKKLSAVLVMAFGMAIAPVAIAPTAQAYVCYVGGVPHYSETTCTQELFPNYTAINAQHVPYFLGETPCFTAEGITYYTPGGHPC